MLHERIKSRWQQISGRFGGDILLGVVTMTTPVVGFVSSLVAARYVDPQEMGIYQTMLLLPTYVGFAHLGVFNGLGRNVPFLHGRGEMMRVQAMVNAAWSVATMLGGLSLIIGLGVMAWLAVVGYSPLHFWALACVLTVMATDPLFTQADSIYRGLRQNAALSGKIALSNSVAFLAGLLPALAGIWGLLAGRSIQAVARIAVLLPGTPCKPNQPGRWTDVVDLGRTGFPLLLAGTLYSFLGVADRSVVAMLMTPADVGNLSLAGLVVTSIQFAPIALTTLLYPRIAACYGRCGTSLGLRRYFWITLGLSVATVVPVSLAAWFLLEPFTLRYLPRYEAGIAAAKIASLGSMGFLYFGVGAIIAVVRRNTMYILMMLIALGTVWGGGALLIAEGHGIEGAAMARAIATGMLSVFTVGYSYWLTTRNIQP
jgi:O-antigen/teichoic acid export membrane protein